MEADFGIDSMSVDRRRHYRHRHDLLHVMYYEHGIGCLASLNALGVLVQSTARFNKKLGKHT
jgi:hypothetical protein